MFDPLPQQRFDDRAEPRDEVLFRTRITLPDRRAVPATLVNLSPHGVMARVDQPVAAGEWITIQLPAIGAATAGVRWSLGGRIGCQLEREIDAATYLAVLAAANAQRGAVTLAPAAAPTALPRRSQ